MTNVEPAVPQPVSPGLQVVQTAPAAPDPTAPSAPFKPNRAVRRRLKKTAFREQAAEKLGVDMAYEVEYDLPDGGIFLLTVESPLFASDETTEQITMIERNDDLDKDEAGEIKSPPTITGPDGVTKPADPQPIRLAKAIVGDDTYAQLKAAGGNASDVMLAYRMLAQTDGIDNDDPKSPEQ